MSLDWRYLIKVGLLAGVFVLYVAVVGMLEAFEEREIILDLVTLGQILLVVGSIVGGYIVARKLSHEGKDASTLLVSGAIVGFISSLLLREVVILSQFYDVREMFVNVTPSLIRILTFDQENILTGFFILMGLLTGSGVLGVVIWLIPAMLRQALLTGLGWMIGLGVMGELVKQILEQFLERDAMRSLLKSDVLLWQTAVGIFVLAAGSSLFWQWRGETVKARYEAMPANRQTPIRMAGLSLLGVFLLVLPRLVGTYLSEVMTIVGLYILMGLGLNIAIGLAGLLDLGYVTNFAVGAYVMGVLTSTGPLGFATRTGIDISGMFWVVLPISVLCAMFTGFVLALPVLRMRGDYLAIATLGFGEIIRLLALSDWLKPLIGGAQGVLFIPKATIFGYEFSGPQQLYYLIFAACLLMLFISVRLNNSRTGRQWMAMREDEDVAGSMGIDTTLAKLLAFTLSAASGGLAGAIFATKLGTIFPHSFQLLISVNVLSLIIVGGMGSIPGIVVGAIALIGLPELLREFSEFRLLLYGALLIVMMLVRPEGLWPSAVTRREMASDEALAVAPSGD